MCCSWCVSFSFALPANATSPLCKPPTQHPIIVLHKHWIRPACCPPCVHHQRVSARVAKPNGASDSFKGGGSDGRRRRTEEGRRQRFRRPFIARVRCGHDAASACPQEGACCRCTERRASKLAARPATTAAEPATSNVSRACAAVIIWIVCWQVGDWHCRRHRRPLAHRAVGQEPNFSSSGLLTARADRDAKLLAAC